MRIENDPWLNEVRKDLAREENWEEINCPRCGQKVKKLKHYGATKCENCNTPILCF